MKIICKHFLIVLILTPLLWRGAGGEAYAQTNLVPNWSFEIDSLCPDGGSEINYAPPWYNPTWGSADYFNTCAGSSITVMGVPLNVLGYQYAKTGDAFAGIYTYDSYVGATNETKEYLQVKLIDSLIQDRKYCISFYVNLAKPPNTFTYNNVAITEIGIYISNNAVLTTNTLTLQNTPQIQSPHGLFLSDTVNWVEISGTYIAIGGERYITIGNFNSQTDTMGIVHHNNYSASYYFVDDVTVRDCTNDGVGDDTNDEAVEVYPNPATNQLTIQLKNNKQKNMLEIKDMLGQTVYTETIHPPTITLDISTYPSGVYFISIRDEKKIINRKFIKE